MKFHLIFTVFFIFLVNFWATAQEYSLEKPSSKMSWESGDNAYLSHSEFSETPIRVKVKKNNIPEDSVVVHMTIVSKPDPSGDFRFIKQDVTTGPDGIAAFDYYAGEISGTYSLAAYVDDGKAGQDFLFYTVHVRSNYWLWMLIFGILGGLALFLTGINVMSDGLRNALGQKLQNILTRSTNTTAKGILTGNLLTIVTQSSSAVSVMLISFVESGLMNGCCAGNYNHHTAYCFSLYRLRPDTRGYWFYHGISVEKSHHPKYWSFLARYRFAVSGTLYYGRESCSLEKLQAILRCLTDTRKSTGRRTGRLYFYCYYAK
jgi:hypothetical protein